MSDFTRWNFEVFNNRLLACRDHHEKGQPCEYEELSADELLGLLEMAQSCALKSEQQWKEIEALTAKVRWLSDAGMELYYLAGNSHDASKAKTAWRKAQKETLQTTLAELTSMYDKVLGKNVVLERERDALAAHVELSLKLARAIENGDDLPHHKWALKCSHLVEKVKQSPQTSLAEFKAKAIEEAFSEFYDSKNWNASNQFLHAGESLKSFIEQHAQQIRKNSNEET